MNKELEDFQYFKDHQLHFVDFKTGRLDTISVKTNQFGAKYTQIRKNVGSKNHDGYIRVWCNNTLRMKHRLLYFLYHDKLPDEIDHINGIRDDNSIDNLRSVDRKEQLQNLHQDSKKGKPKYKLSELDVYQIKLQLKHGKSTNEIAKHFNVSRSLISDIKNNRRRKKDLF